MSTNDPTTIDGILSGFRIRNVSIPRDGDVPLVFEGVLLGEGKTSVPAVDKYSGIMSGRGHEARIYQAHTEPFEVHTYASEKQGDGSTHLRVTGTETRNEKYVLEFVAWSNISTESTKNKVIVCDTPKDLYEEMTKLTIKGIPTAALDALAAAAGKDPRLLEIATERI